MLNCPRSAKRQMVFYSGTLQLRPQETKYVVSITALASARALGQLVAVPAAVQRGTVVATAKLQTHARLLQMETRVKMEGPLLGQPVAVPAAVRRVTAAATAKRQMHARLLQTAKCVRTEALPAARQVVAVVTARWGIVVIIVRQHSRVQLDSNIQRSVSHQLASASTT